MSLEIQIQLLHKPRGAIVLSSVIEADENLRQVGVQRSSASEPGRVQEPGATTQGTEGTSSVAD